MLIGEQTYMPGPGQQVRSETGSVFIIREHGHAFVFHFITIAIRTMKHTPTIKLAKPRTVWSEISQTSCEQQSPRLDNPLLITGNHTKVLSRDLLDANHTRLDDQPAMARHFIATSR